MKKIKLFSLSILCFLGASVLVPVVSAQDQIFVPHTQALPVPQDEALQALNATRFHFMSLMKFRSEIFSAAPEDGKMSQSDILILRAGLNTFLSSVGREKMLLEALRQNKAIRISFMTPKGQSVADTLKDPANPVLYQFEPAFRAQRASVEIQPFFDEQNAFRILVRKETTYQVYDIGWAGNIAHIKEVPIP